MVKLIFKDGTEIPSKKATLAQWNNWRDEAATPEERQKRKQFSFALLYNATPSKLIELFASPGTVAGRLTNQSGAIQDIERPGK